MLIKEIEDILSCYNINDYSISEDGLVTVYKSVVISSYLTSEIGIKFDVVYGDFFIEGNLITTLQGSPKEVHGSFDCSNNYLTSLEFSPTIVLGDFLCNSNILTSLMGCPVEVVGNFDCSHNKIESLNGCPRLIKGHFICYNNVEINSLNHMPLQIGGLLILPDHQITREDLLMSISESNIPVSNILCGYDTKRLVILLRSFNLKKLIYES